MGVVDKGLCDEIAAETRKKYVGKVAEKRATELFAAEPDPCGRRKPPWLVVVILAGVVGVGVRYSQETSNASAGARPTSGGNSALFSPPAWDFRTAADVIKGIYKVSDKYCQHVGNCGMHAETSDSSSPSDLVGIFHLTYDPSQDGSGEIGWKTFTWAAGHLNCDLEAAFGWTSEDEGSGRRPTTSVAVYC